MQSGRNGPASLLLISFFSFIVIGIPGGALGVAWLPRRLIQAELDSNKLVDLSDTLGSVALQESMYWNRGAQSQLSQEVIEAIETALVV